MKSILMLIIGGVIGFLVGSSFTLNSVNSVSQEQLNIVTQDYLQSVQDTVKNAGNSFSGGITSGMQAQVQATLEAKLNEKKQEFLDATRAKVENGVLGVIDSRFGSKKSE